MNTRRRIVAFIHIITATLVAIYTLGMLGLAAVWVVAPERTWWIALSNILAPHLYLPLIMIVPLVVLFRSRAIGLMAGVLVLLFVAQSASQLLPQSGTEVAEGSLRVITFNQLYRNDDLQGSLAVLKAQHADLIALQELSTPMVEAIERDPEMVERYPYRWFEPAESAAGLGVLSRLPFTQLPGSDDVLMQAVQIEVAGQQITFINAHPLAPALSVSRLDDVAWLDDVPVVSRLPVVRSYNPRRRNEQLLALIDDIDQRQGPILLAGDLNTADRDPKYALLAARMRDAYSSTSWGFGRTYPNIRFWDNVSIPFPLVRIDYVWTRGNITPVHTEVNCEAQASDHCMLIADVQVG